MIRRVIDRATPSKMSHLPKSTGLYSAVQMSVSICSRKFVTWLHFCRLDPLEKSSPITISADSSGTRRADRGETRRISNFETGAENAIGSDDLSRFGVWQGLSIDDWSKGLMNQGFEPKPRHVTIPTAFSFPVPKLLILLVPPLTVQKSVLKMVCDSRVNERRVNTEENAPTPRRERKSAWHTCIDCIIRSSSTSLASFALNSSPAGRSCIKDGTYRVSDYC